MSPYTFRRKAARVVLLDREGRILLLHASDPIDPYKPSWWEIPGGGLIPGESTADGAERELYEETGIRPVEMGPCIWTQHNVFDFAGYHFDQDEFIHVAWCDGGEYKPAHLEALEAEAFDGGRWWDLADLLANDEPTLPARLRELLPAIVDGTLPDPPLNIGEPGTAVSS